VSRDVEVPVGMSGHDSLCPVYVAMPENQCGYCRLIARARADERRKAIERVEAWLDRDEWGEAEFVRSAVIDALRGESNG